MTHYSIEDKYTSNIEKIAFCKDRRISNNAKMVMQITVKYVISNKCLDYTTKIQIIT